MSSTINTSNLRTYKKDNNEFIIPGAMLNSAIVSNEGADGFYSVFAHQINWSYTTFGNIDISTKPGTTYTEKLLNTIESYICSYVSSTGVTNKPVISNNGNKTYINVNGKKSNEIYIPYATHANTAGEADRAINVYQYKNTSNAGKSELLFALHNTDNTDPKITTTYYDRSIYVDHSNGNRLVSYGFCVAQADGSIYGSGYLLTADGAAVHQSYLNVGKANGANRLVTTRTISLTGAVTGTTTFNGSANASITTTIDKNKLISNNIELNTDKSLRNYGGFIDFHYVNSNGNFTNSGIESTEITDYTSRIIETAEGQLSINGVRCIYSGIAYANSFYQTSDINYKNIISYDCNLSVTDIANAPIIKFTWKESPNNSYQIGTIAQYWQTYLPESIGENEKLSLNYSVVGTISGIVNAREIVELKKENKELKQEIKELKEKMNKILQYLNI